MQKKDSRLAPRCFLQHSRRVCIQLVCLVVRDQSSLESGEVQQEETLYGGAWAATGDTLHPATEG